jgi:hypothetical protein
MRDYNRIRYQKRLQDEKEAHRQLKEALTNHESKEQDEPDDSLPEVS